MAAGNRPLPRPSIQYGLHANAAQIMASADAAANQMLFNGFISMGRQISTQQQAKKNRRHQKAMQASSQAHQRAMQDEQLDASANRWKAEQTLANSRAILQMRTGQAQQLIDQRNAYVTANMPVPKELD